MRRAIGLVLSFCGICCMIAGGIGAGGVALMFLTGFLLSGGREYGDFLSWFAGAAVLGLALGWVLYKLGNRLLARRATLAA